LHTDYETEGTRITAKLAEEFIAVFEPFRAEPAASA
jgi:hypothetical protein